VVPDVVTALPREPRQERSRATRARLLEAAVDSLAEVGYAASTVAVVAERAGVSRGAAQHHFPTRDALFTAALEHVSGVRTAELLRAREGLADGALSTEEVVELVLALFTGPLFRAALALWVAAAAEPSLRAQVVPLEARIGRQVHRVVVELLGVDETVPGVRETVQATLDLGRGLGLAALLTDDSRRRRRIVRQWARLLETALGR
jgi:AcrR family transcriptional regulator